MAGETNLTYGIRRELWGRGLATEAVRAFLQEVPLRALVARAARDNLGSLRVLEKCGFRVIRHERGHTNARQQEIDEVALALE